MDVMGKTTARNLKKYIFRMVFNFLFVIILVLFNDFHFIPKYRSYKFIDVKFQQ